MRAVVDKLQGAPGEPPGYMGVCTGIRLGPDAPGWGPPVPSAQQPEAPGHQSEGNQPETADVTGKKRLSTSVMPGPRAVAKLQLSAREERATRLSGRYISIKLSCFSVKACV